MYYAADTRRKKTERRDGKCEALIACESEFIFVNVAVVQCRYHRNARADYSLYQIGRHRCNSRVEDLRGPMFRNLHMASGCNRLCFSLLGAEIQPAVFVLFIRHFCFLSHLVPKRHRFISILFVYKHLFRQLHVVADNDLLPVQIIYFEFVDFSERNHVCYDGENNTQSRSGKTSYKIRLG